jgi:DNA (cytosine-5)-methyltransferase 1
MRPTAATFFCGAGGACSGLAQAGFDIVWGNEFNEAIGAIWSLNHLDAHLNSQDILEVPLNQIPWADLYWFSPPCPEFSKAKNNRTGGTNAENTSIAERIAAIILAKKPRWVIIENVEGYASSLSLPIILKALTEIGHVYDQIIYNAADYGTPQSRKRLIIRSGYILPPPPASTHSDRHASQIPLFGDRLLPWVGWYAALIDLLPTLPPSKLSKPQLAELEKRGLLNPLSASLIDGQANNHGKSITVRSLNQPAPTVLANTGTRQVSRIVLVQLTGYHNSRGPSVKTVDQPVFTITASMSHDGKPNKSGHPSFRPPATIATETQVLKVTRPCLARFQGFPDDHRWGKFESVNCRAIGNAVPIQLAAAIGRSILRENL